jgi:hypothetical protein
MLALAHLMLLPFPRSSHPNLHEILTFFPVQFRGFSVAGLELSEGFVFCWLGQFPPSAEWLHTRRLLIVARP